MVNSFEGIEQQGKERNCSLVVIFLFHLGNRAFSYISVLLQFGYSADVQFSVPSSSTVCLLSSSSCEIFLKFCVFCRTSGGASDCKCPTVSTGECPMDILL